MDRTEKFLRRLTTKEHQRIAKVIEQIITSNLEGLDIKKLKGSDTRFRVRVGRVRIVYEQHDDWVEILFAGFRNEGTYKGM